MQVSLSALVEQIKSLPRWNEISRMAKDENFSDEFIAHALLSIVNFNAPGLVNPIANAFFLLPLLPSQGKELLTDGQLMDSFCWELLRFSSRTFIVPAKPKDGKKDGNSKADNSFTVYSSNGESYRVKGDTLLFTHLPVVMRDEKYWAEPNLFKAGRFRNSLGLDDSISNDNMLAKVNDSHESSNTASNIADDSGPKEPLPTLVFGCPLGRLLNRDEHQNGRRCPFSLLGHPFMKEFVTVLVKNYRWRVDLTSRKKLGDLVVSKDAASREVLVVDFSPEHLTGGFFKEADQIPKLSWTGARFADFEELQDN